MQETVYASPYATLVAAGCVFAALAWAMRAPYVQIAALRRTAALEKASRMVLQSRLEEIARACDARLSAVETDRWAGFGSGGDRPQAPERESANQRAGSCGGLGRAELELLREVERAIALAEP